MLFGVVFEALETIQEIGTDVGPLPDVGKTLLLKMSSLQVLESRCDLWESFLPAADLQPPRRCPAGC